VGPRVYVVSKVRRMRTAANCPRGPVAATAAVRLARRLAPSTCTCTPSRLKSTASVGQAVRVSCCTLWVIRLRSRCIDGSNDLRRGSPALESVLASFHRCIQLGAFCSRPINPRGSSIAKTVSLKMFYRAIFQPRSLRLNTHVPVDTTSMCRRHASDNQTWFFRTEKPTPLHGALLLAHESGNP